MAARKPLQRRWIIFDVSSSLPNPARIETYLPRSSGRLTIGGDGGDRDTWQDLIVAEGDRAILDERLSPSERAILLDRYGENPANLDELGRQFAFSDETIRQKEAKALAKVRAAAKGGKD
jgi:hypothetical protein